MPTGDFTTTSNGTGSVWLGGTSSDIKFYVNDNNTGTYFVKPQTYTYVPDDNEDIMKMLQEMVKEGDKPTLENLNQKIQQQDRRIESLEAKIKDLRAKAKEVAKENKDLREFLDVTLEGILSLMPVNYQERLRD